jgi:hypothetical protein
MNRHSRRSSPHHTQESHGQSNESEFAQTTNATFAFDDPTNATVMPAGKPTSIPQEQEEFMILTKQIQQAKGDPIIDVTIDAVRLRSPKTFQRRAAEIFHCSVDRQISSPALC